MNLSLEIIYFLDGVKVVADALSRRAHRPNSREVRHTATCDNASLRVPTPQIYDPTPQIATKIKHSRKQYLWNCITQRHRISNRETTGTTFESRGQQRLGCTKRTINYDTNQETSRSQRLRS
jgi:ribosomal protein S18